MLIPPGYERLVIGSTIAYLPINLRHTIVYPTIIHPKQYICIKIIIILEAESFRTIRIGTLVAVDAEWRNTKLDPRLNGMNGFAELLYNRLTLSRRQSPMFRMPRDCWRKSC